MWIERYETRLYIAALQDKNSRKVKWFETLVRLVAYQQCSLNSVMGPLLAGTQRATCWMSGGAVRYDELEFRGYVSFRARIDTVNQHL